MHTFRHSAATAWIQAGVNIKAVSTLLGHADIRITADVHGHVSDAVARAAMETLCRASCTPDRQTPPPKPAARAHAPVGRCPREAAGNALRYGPVEQQRGRPGSLRSGL